MVFCDPHHEKVSVRKRRLQKKQAGTDLQLSPPLIREGYQMDGGWKRPASRRRMILSLFFSTFSVRYKCR